MTADEKLQILRSMIGEDDSDAMLSTYLTIAGQKIIDKAFPYKEGITEVPSKYHLKQCEIAAYLINKVGAEGELSHDENGIKRTYADADIPASLYRGIIPECGVLS